jgi:hypothetical protein
MANETMIPILPCRSIKDTLAFYVAMGFEITYQQERPNTYACVKWGAIDLHFFTLKDYDPAQSYSSCLIVADDLDNIYQQVVASLRQHYGKLPVAGIQRITKPNNNNAACDRRFNIADPGGNWIRFSQRTTAQNTEPEPVKEKAVSTKLSRAFHAAELIAETKGDAEAAAKMLDTALAYDKQVPAIQRVKALALRATLALTMGDKVLSNKMLGDVRHITLNDDERTALTEELQRINDLEQMPA